jgi:sarcosine oxidase subunit delta
VKILNCPINGPRPLQEFQYGGELRSMPNPDTCSDVEWTDYLFNRSGEPGVSREWWYHSASGTWFIAERDIVNDIFLKTYMYDAEAKHG